MLSLRRVRKQALIPAIVLSLVSVYYLWTFTTPSHTRLRIARHIPADHLCSQDDKTDISTALSQEYALPELDDEVCESKYGLSYLDDISRSGASYCEPVETQSQLACFMSPSRNKETDIFCTASRLLWDPETRKFEINCRLRNWNSPDLTGMPQVNHLPHHWYETGPGHVFEHHIRVGDDPDKIANQNCTDLEIPGNKPKSFVLIKREGPYNLWHCLMEIFSYMITMDATQMVAFSNGNMAVSGDRTVFLKDSQVLILDDFEPGPYFELWGLITGRPATRLDAMQNTSSLCVDNVIVPLAGASSPLWDGDWIPHNCDRSALLRGFVNRVLRLFPAIEPRGLSAPITVTVIDRKSTRHLQEQDTLITSLKARFEHVVIQSIDFAAIPFAEQLAIIRKTDVLVGVHGAGLTHTMFLPPESTVVEILPNGLAHKGFRNLAHMTGHTYFSTHGARDEVPEGSDWHAEEVRMEDERFLEVVSLAVKSTYHRGLLHNDVN